jgi:hypothetical protein
VRQAKNRRNLLKIRERAYKPDSSGYVAGKQVVLFSTRGTVNDVSFGSVGRFWVTIGSQVFARRQRDFALARLGLCCPAVGALLSETAHRGDNIRLSHPRQ